MLIIIPAAASAEGCTLNGNNICVACPSQCSMASGTCSCTPGTTVTLIATIGSGTPSQRISFYNNGALLGQGIFQSCTTGSCTACTTSDPCTYTYDFNMPGCAVGTPCPAYSITASTSSTNATGSNTNGPIDLVGSNEYPNFKYDGTNFNPALDHNFSHNSTDYWVAGDNQMCMTNWPYNGKTAAFPDGTCEWFDGPAPCSGSACTSASRTPSPQSTVSSLNDVLHTFSDFDKFAQSILGKSLETTTSSFHSIYTQIAAWVAPQCGSGSCQQVKCADGSTCGANGLCGDGVTTCDACAFNRDNCNPDGPGRLLSIYNPYVSPPVDKLKDWNTVITSWLNTSFTASGATSKISGSSSSNPAEWCLPERTDMASDATELYYIDKNAPTGTWGDLPHVLACLKYNAGPTSAETANYSACANSLVTNNSCLENLPSSCSPTVLSTPLLPAPSFTVTDSNRCNVCKDGSLCGSGGTDKCQDGSACVEGTYADWVANQYRYGPIYNYQTCLNVLNGGCDDGSVCGSGGTNPNKCANGKTCGPCGTTNNSYASQSSVCAASVLGRSLTAAYSGSRGCNNTFKTWVQNNLTLFNDESPKFALRYAYLKDVYDRAITLQRITADADYALHNFFKPCSGCAYGNCGDGGPNKCGDGSACGQSLCPDNTTCSSDSDCSNGGSCNQCADGGPVAQIMYARTQKKTTATLPNSVIYGWRDKPTLGQSPCGTACSDNSLCGSGGTGKCQNGSACQPLGCEHIVRVTAFSPGRTGGNGVFQDRLPWIDSYTSDWGFTQNYELTQRDGYVYVGIERWDQPHTSAVAFPNKRSLWQFMFTNPGAAQSNISQDTDPIDACSTTAYSQFGLPAGQKIGLGITQQMAEGLAYYSSKGQLLAPDVDALGGAFMLNDRSNGGRIDPFAVAHGAGVGGDCTRAVSALLEMGVKSHACARYVADIRCPAGGSDSGAGDYCIQFVDCNKLGSTPTSDGP
ncbi:MAG: hypothetical protein KGK03_01405 [Candidatus Omnitrophica bacterium]|nr:hypothetical protein [Candidatus Omnitrophota bacterium]